MVDAADRVWVADYGGDWWDPDSATVFGRSGALIGRVGLPPGVHPVLVSDSLLIGVRLTEAGVPTVVAHRIVGW